MPPPVGPHPDPFVESGQDLETFLPLFWDRQTQTVENEDPDIKHTPLPLARIKKVMKSDPEVKMISADAPLLFAKACEVFISELSARAFIVAESNKRRTITRADIAAAAGECDMFDFLIDFFLPEERRPHGHPASASAARVAAASEGADTPVSGYRKGKRKNTAGEDPYQNLDNADAEAVVAEPSTSASGKGPRRRASASAKKPRKMSIAEVDTGTENDIPTTSPLTETFAASVSWNPNLVQSQPSHRTQFVQKAPGILGNQQPQATSGTSSAQAPSVATSGFRATETMDESNVFYQQIQTYIHAPHPPQTHLPLPPRNQQFSRQKPPSQ